jgi:hypothetical protein
MTCGLLGHSTLFAIQTSGYLGAGYLHREHGTVPIAIVCAAVLACVALAAYILRAHNCTSGSDVVRLANSFTSRRASTGLLTIPMLGMLTLAAMEAGEHSLAGAFGATPAFGVMLVVGIGAGLAIITRAFAGWIAAATQHIVAALHVFVRRLQAKPPASARRFVPVVRIRRHDVYRRVRCLRAPPFVLA